MSVLGKILVRLGLDSSEFTKGTRDAEKLTQGFTGKIGGMFTKMFAGLAVGAAFKKAFNFSKEAFQAAAQVQGVKMAFDRLNDPNLLNGLKEATRGTVDELKLMQLSVQAKNFRLPVEQLGTYLKFATKRAQETGMSVDYLTNSIITGLGRKSILILDNLGISAVEIREEMKKGGDMATAVGRIIQREMAKAGEITETAAIKAEKISAKWSDFKGNLGNTSAIQKAGGAIQNFLIVALDRLNDLTTSLGNNEVQSWLGKIDTQSDIDKAEAIASKLREVNAEIEKLEKTAPEGWFDKGVHNVTAGISALFGHESDYAKLGKLKNYRMSIYDKQKDETLTSTTKDHIATLNLKKKTDAELLTLQKQYKRESCLLNHEMVRISIAEEAKLRSDAAAVASDNAVKEAEKRAEEITKAQLSYKEGENSTSISQLEKQKGAYGDTLVYMEQLLQLRREQESYAKSNVEYKHLKSENDALEKQISLRKQPLGVQTGSETDLKNQLSEAEAEMSKLNTRTQEGGQRFLELHKIIANLKWQIDRLPQNYILSANVELEGFDDFVTQFNTDLDTIGNRWKKWLDDTEQAQEEFRNIIEHGAQAALMGLGEAIGALASGDTDAIWQMLLNPIADMAIQLGQLAIATGITMEGIKASFETLGGVGAIAAGLALVALGTAIKGAIGNIGGGKGAQSTQSSNTFTGGYSNGGSSTRTAQSLQLASPQSQTITVKGELSGGELRFILDREEQRRKR